MKNISPWKCSYCEHAWLLNEKTPEAWFTSSLMVWLRALPHALKEEDDKDVGVRILLEFDEPALGASSASTL